MRRDATALGPCGGTLPRWDHAAGRYRGGTMRRDATAAGPCGGTLPRSQPLGLVSRLDPPGPVERQLRVAPTSFALDRLEHEAAMVAEVHPLEDPPREPVLEVDQDRSALRARSPLAASELVDLIPSLAAEQLGKLDRVLGDEVHDEDVSLAGDPERAVLHRQADQEAGR